MTSEQGLTPSIPSLRLMALYFVIPTLSFQVQRRELDSVTTINCPRTLLRHGLLTATQIRRLWVGVGHPVHEIVMEYEDGSQNGEMLYDDGTLMSLSVSHDQLELRATAILFVRGEIHHQDPQCQMHPYQVSTTCSCLHKTL